MNNIKYIIYLLVVTFAFVACNDENLPTSNFSTFQVEDVKTTAGDTQVLIEWTPSTKGNPDEFYITWTADAVGIEGGEATVAITVNSFLIEGLVNNIGYTFNVQGRYGEGLSRKVSSAATPKSTRFDVENLLAAAGTEKVRLSWNKPLSNALTGYQITVNPGNRILDINDPALDRYVIDALSNNVEYNFKVVAIYTNGASEGVTAVATPGVVLPITVSSIEVVQNQSILFEYNDMFFLADDILGVTWSFGDGVISQDKAPSHYYSTPGVYTVIATITYANGTTESGSIDITVTSFKWGMVDIVNGTYAGYVKASNPVFSPDGTTVYLPTSNAKGDMFAIDVFTGEIKWVYSISNVTYGGGAVVGRDGSIYQGAQGSKLFAVKPNGTEKWTLTLKGNVEGFPAITSDDVLYVVCNSNPVTLYALNASTGSEIWNKTIDGTVGSAVAVDADGNIYAGTNQAIYSFTTDGTERWKTATAINVTERGSFALNGSTLYATLKSGAGLAAVDMVSGDVKWTYANSAANHDAFFPIVGKDGTIYFTNRSGTAANAAIMAINPDGSLKWSNTPGAALIYAGLVLSEEGKLYVGTQGRSGSNYLILEIDAATGEMTTQAIDQQMMSAFTIAPDRRVYFGSVAAKLNTIDINAGLETASWSVRGGNLQGTNSLR